MAFTYSPIASVTVGASGASTIDFINIPQNYTDLVLYLSGRSDSNYGQPYYECYLRINTIAGSGRDLYGNGSSSASATSGEMRIWGVTSSGATSNTFGNSLIYIPNYTSSANKSISTDSVSENNATASMASLTASICSNTTAIFNLSIVPYSTGKFVQYSTATLYGIRATEY